MAVLLHTSGGVLCSLSLPDRWNEIFSDLWITRGHIASFSWHFLIHSKKRMTDMPLPSEWLEKSSERANLWTMRNQSRTRSRTTSPSKRPCGALAFLKERLNDRQGRKIQWQNGWGYSSCRRHDSGLSALGRSFGRGDIADWGCQEP